VKNEGSKYIEIKNIKIQMKRQFIDAKIFLMKLEHFSGIL
jgi:hypothetical protein